MPKLARHKRFYSQRDSRNKSVVLHEGIFGTAVPLLDVDGQPMNFERKPMALKAALAAMDYLDGNKGKRDEL